MTQKRVRSIRVFKTERTNYGHIVSIFKDLNISTGCPYEVSINSKIKLETIRSLEDSLYHSSEHQIYVHLMLADDQLKMAAPQI